jgi:DNA-directed RNA polymerase specialized sigma24 family protein
MSDAERFDAFYTDARDRLLVLSFALTGDLAASRGAVRDAFIAAWHHWAKVRRLDDPESWVRPHAWSHAQRRHTARIWHRDRKLDPEIRATLDALAKLPLASRKALLLTQLTPTSRQEMAREVGLPLEEAEARLQSATTQFSLQREVPSTAVRALMDQLASHCSGQRWPRATIIRRSGTTRRRTHAVAGVALVVATVVGAGFLVHDTSGVHPTLAAAGDRLTDVPTMVPGPHGPVQVPTDALVTRAQIGRALPGQAWRITGTDPAQGPTLPCQRRAYADPDAAATLVRNFTPARTGGAPPMAAVQTVEYSQDDAGATRGFATAGSWFAGCTTAQTQLLAERRVSGLGDQAQQYVLRAWQKPAVTFVLGVARTGSATTVALTRADGAPNAGIRPNLRFLTTAVDNLCSTSVGGRCAGHVRAAAVRVPPVGPLPMMVGAYDLPPVAGVQRPWVGTTPRQPLQNAAATGCDDSVFHGGGWTHAATRSFLIPGAHLASAFGLTETVGRLPEPRARAFVAGVATKLRTCPHRDPANKVAPLGRGHSATAWRVRTQVSNKQTVTFYMGVVRAGGAVAQVGFVPDGAHAMTTAAFLALLRRAGERLSYLPH